MAPKSHGDDVVSSPAAAVVDWPWVEALDADSLGQDDIAKVSFQDDFVKQVFISINYFPIS